MAEFLNTPKQVAQRASDDVTADGMNNFGKAVPYYRRKAAEEHCKQMGMTAANKITGMLQRACDSIERDEPYAAMEALTAYLDLTGCYRVLAVLLTAPAPAEANEPPEDKPVKRGPTVEEAPIVPYGDYA